MNFLVVATLENPSASASSLALKGLQKLETRYMARLFKSSTLRTLWRLAMSFQMMESKSVER